MCCITCAEQFSVGKYLHLGPSTRVEANAILAISQPYILMNNFTATSSQKFKLCSCFMLQAYIMTNLDKSRCSRLRSSMVMFFYLRDITILRGHFLLLLWAVNISESHAALHCMPNFCTWARTGSNSVWERLVSLTRDIQVEILSSIPCSVFSFGLCVWLYTTSSVG